MIPTAARTTLLVAAALIAGAVASAPSPARAMCGGNIFMTCPPVQKTEAERRRELKKRDKPEKRRHYPLNRK